MARDPQITEQPVTPQSVDGTKPDVQPVDTAGEADPYAGVGEVDKAYWLACLDDAERAEQPWRKRGREVVQIYRNEQATGIGKKNAGSGVTFNILFANTEVMAGAVYQQPPKPVVRSRFTNVMPAVPPIPLPAMMPPGGAPPLPPPGLPPSEPGGDMGAPPPVPAPAGPAPLAGGPPGGPAPIQPPPVAVGGPPGPPLPPQAAAPAPGGVPPLLPPGPPGAPPDMMGAPPAPPPPAAMMPDQITAPSGAPHPPPALVDTAASVMEKALEIVLDDEQSNEAVRMAIKDVLLPGRGTCRVRWKPEMKAFNLPGGPLPDGTAPTEERKVWEQVNDEYVYWEDLLVDPVRAAADCDWMAFRHLFTKESLESEFAGSPQYELLKTNNRLNEILKWTDESAAKSPVGGGSAMKSARHLGDHVRKAMLWEIWHRPTRTIIWFIREASGVVMRVDQDTLDLEGFYPSPVPLLAVTTTDSRIPRPYYDLYANLAADLDETSRRISAITKQVKARGAYNSASKEIADLLLAGDNKMLAVDGVDMLNGGLQNHLWMMPIEIYVQVLNQLYIARDQVKQAIYEIMGISDIMRGATKATETATAQRIKGSMGVSRLEDQKQSAAGFVRDLLRLKAEIIANNFDAETLAAMTGEEVTPEVMQILRSDFMRTCLIDIESDSTVVPDQQAEQEGMAQVMQSVGIVMQGTQQMLMTQIMPPPQVIQLGLELLKMALHPIRYSRPVVELVDKMQAQLQLQAMMPPPPPQAPPSLPVGAGAPGGPPGAGPPAGPPRAPGGPPPSGNGAMPPGMPPPPMQPPPMM